MREEVGRKMKRRKAEHLIEMVPKWSRYILQKNFGSRLHPLIISVKNNWLQRHVVIVNVEKEKNEK